MRQVLQRCCAAGPLVARLPCVPRRALSSLVTPFASTALRLARDAPGSPRRVDASVFRAAQPTRDFGDVASRGGGEGKPQVLVKVGNGQYCLVKLDLAGMDRTSLLKALKHDEGFSRSLDVALDQCILTVCASASEDEPTASEAAAACKLQGTKTLGTSAAWTAAAAAAAGANVFVNVTLPGGSSTITAHATAAPVPPPRASVASMPFNAHLQIPEDVWGGMGPLAQKTAATAGAQRALLARSLPLRELGKALPAAEASRLGITVLREVEGEVSLGLFTLPKLDDAVQDPPKTFEASTVQSHQLLLLPQRLNLAWEFVQSTKAATRGSGVLLSGPNGVGKSGVGFLSYLLCAARHLPVVYLNSTQSWVRDAQRGEGDAFLLSAFWEQNADLIAASEPLRAVFTAAMRDEAGAFTPQVMDALRRTARRHRLGIGVILDEVQHITATVQRGNVDAATSGQRTAGDYFRYSWHDWMNNNSVFARMGIASAHGKRDFKLPSGEGHRLRIVEPLTDGQREALQSHPGSPAFVRDPDARQRIIFYSGNVLRALMNAGCALPSTGCAAALNAELSRRLGRMNAAMLEDCQSWLASLPEDARNAVASASMDLLIGKVPWSEAKGLYDAGIMYRSVGSEFLRPVSAAASSAYLTCTAALIRGSAQPLSSHTDGRTRGFELEKQVLAGLVHANTLVGVKLLDGEECDSLHLRGSYALPFSALNEVVPRESPVLYRPLSLTFPCDGILMPAAGDKESAIVIVECSTTDPRSAARVDKVLRFLEPTGVVSALGRAFPALRRVVMLVYDGALQKLELSSFAAAALSHGQHPRVAAAPPGAVSAAQAATLMDERASATSPAAAVEVRVLDRSSLARLRGVVL